MICGTWNVRSLNSPGAAQGLSATLQRYHVQLAALQEIRWPGKGETRIAGFTYFYSGHDTARELGTGFAVRDELLPSVLDFQPVNHRLCTLRTKGRWFNYSWVCVHAPTEESAEAEKDDFYDTLDMVCSRLPKHDVKVLLGDWNAKLGKEDLFRPSLGRWSLHDMCNDNGIRFASFATAKGLAIASTMFPHKNIHKGTWRSPDGRTVNQIDHVAIDGRHKSGVEDVRTVRGADCDSDHFLVRCRMRMRLRSKPRPRAQPRRRRLNTELLQEEQMRTQFRVEVANRFSCLALGEEEADVDEEWAKIRDAVWAAASTTVGFRRRRRNKAFYDDECEAAVERRSEARMEALAHPGDATRQAEWTEARLAARRLLKAKKREYLSRLATNLEAESHRSNSRGFFEQLKGLRNGFQARTDIIRSRQGVLVADRDRVLERWREYFQELLNGEVPVHPIPEPDFIG